MTDRGSAIVTTECWENT